MTLTLLIDLDDTLLGNDIDRFLPAYLKALGKHLYQRVAPDKMVHDLLAATQVMLANNSSADTLEHSFDRAFYPAIGHSKESLRETLEQFYREVFPGLQPLTELRPDAVVMVNTALKNGHHVVVATNPLFPEMAIHHRLRWAGLDPDQTAFDLITTYERFHFAKPNPTYFAEILAQLGWPADPAVVIGNSLEDDLIPAAQLGLPVFWVCDPALPLPEGFHPLSRSGPVSAISGWLEDVDRADVRQEFLSAAALLAVLKATPAAFDTLIHDLTPRQWRERPDEDAWSLTEIFCHLRDVDLEVNLPRFDAVIAGENPFLPGINTDPWAEERNYRNEDGVEALRRFIEVRGQVVARLEAISQEDWKLPARHAIFGPTNLRELVSFVATHDKDHVRQTMETVQTLR